MRKLVWILAAVMLILHQDFWAWGDRTLMMGFLPIGLAYHMAFSLAAAGLWFSAVKFAWPTEVEAWADETEAPSAAAASTPTTEDSR